MLDILVQPRCDANAAKRFFKRLLKGLQYVPRVLVTDKLRSYGVAQRQLLTGVEHRQSRYLNNRAENSHRPTRPVRMSGSDHIGRTTYAPLFPSAAIAAARVNRAAEATLSRHKTGKDI